ncbi:MAG: PIG-L deacetylase family protein [Candidatus Roizmanbacteria bacterium]
MTKTYTYTEIFENKKRVLFFPAHPDDILIFFGGLVNQLRKDGKEVFVVTVSNGARGSRDSIISEEELAKIRINEEIAGLEYLNVPKKNHMCLNYRDGEVESNMKLIGEVVKYIRMFKPDIVCTHEPSLIYQGNSDGVGYWVQHRDHRKVGEAIIDASYPFSRDRSFFPEHAEEGLEPHAVYDLLLTEENGVNFKLDCTDEIEMKKSAMRLHKSQMDELFIDSVVGDMKEDGRYMEYFKYVHLLW